MVWVQKCGHACILYVIIVEKEVKSKEPNRAGDFSQYCVSKDSM